MRRFLPKSLLGQMLLSVAFALLVAQALSAILLFRAQEQRREVGRISALAFQLIAEPRFDYRSVAEPENDAGNDAENSETRAPNQRRPGWRRLRLERSATSPLSAHDIRQTEREASLRAMLEAQDIAIGELAITSRPVSEDAFIMNQLQERPRSENRWNQNGQILVAGLKRDGSDEWLVARLPLAGPEPAALGSLILQTLVLYLVLVGGLALLLRRITRPLAALKDRVTLFGETRETAGQLEPTGPEDMRRLITAHNAMEGRIAALINEKDVMLGAIGHDLKTPLAALRVRIETVDDDGERQKMAESIEDITTSLDDILSLARVGRPSDPLERTGLAALVSGVVEEYEDMNEPVTLGDTQRLALPLRATWMRRAIRNLVSNALRYGDKARISLVEEAGMAVITIEDDGPGIAEDQMEAMLEPFVRGDASRNRTTGGSGLGLTLARAIAEQHSGELILANRMGEDGKVSGLTARLVLPLLS